MYIRTHTGYIICQHIEEKGRTLRYFIKRKMIVTHYKERSEEDGEV